MWCGPRKPGWARVATTRRPGEFELIARYLAPLAAGHPGSLGLTDDAAVLALSPGRELVVTTDTVVAGVHFPPDGGPDLVARRLLRTNLSDLASMGARPEGYLLNLCLSADCDEAWIAAFAEGLAADQAEFGVALLGGDTVGTSGPVVLGVTALGSVPSGRALRRSGARPGDLVFVTGWIGDGAFGLRAVQGSLDGVDPGLRVVLARRFWLPSPRLAAGQALAGGEGGAPPVATAAADVSDGLIADLGHICDASGVAAVVDAARVPLSAGTAAAVVADPAGLATALTGGDDYELVFTAPPEAAARLAVLATALGVPMTEIGRVEAGRGVRVCDSAGRDMTLDAGGFTHF